MEGQLGVLRGLRLLLHAGVIVGVRPSDDLELNLLLAFLCKSSNKFYFYHCCLGLAWRRIS